MIPQQITFSSMLLRNCSSVQIYSNCFYDQQLRFGVCKICAALYSFE